MPLPRTRVHKMAALAWSEGGVFSLLTSKGRLSDICVGPVEGLVASTGLKWTRSSNSWKTAHTPITMVTQAPGRCYLWEPSGSQIAYCLSSTVNNGWVKQLKAIISNCKKEKNFSYLLLNHQWLTAGFNTSYSLVIPHSWGILGDNRSNYFLLNLGIDLG